MPERTVGQAVAVRQVQRIGAYGICRDHGGRVLVVRASPRTTVAGRWFLPGGGLEHGESPSDGLRRELAEETGLTLGRARLAGVLSDTRLLPDGTSLHAVRCIYAVEDWAGEARPEADGTSDAVAWVDPGDFGGLAVMDYVVDALALPGAG